MFDKPGLDKKLHGFMTTYLREDALYGDKELFISTIFMYEAGSKEQFEGWFDTLRKYSKDTGCSKVVAITSYDGLKALYEA